MQSPEKYIKQKARTLPIKECWINSEWKTDGLAHAFVSRIHVTGNYTVGMYLVDLKCLGVKDTMYFFNMDAGEYQNLINQVKNNLTTEIATYNLVHNIVFAGLEYAEDLGFAPHKDFKISEYILEEDTEDIELLDIECGLHGKPFYIRGPHESDLQAAQIIHQLTSRVGIGNFEIAHGDIEDFDDDIEAEIENSIYTNEDLGNHKTFQFKIQIKGITKPPIWRRISIPNYYSFWDLHHVIQNAFGWENCHLYSFSPTGYGSKPLIQEIHEGMDDFGFEDPLDAEELQLSSIFKKEGQKYTYIYDFGDNWTHQITLEKIIEESSDAPNCLAGKGKCPPEDCGGIGRFKQLKEILMDKDHPEYKDYKEWLGLAWNEEWDAKEFDLKAIQEDFVKLYESEPE